MQYKFIILHTGHGARYANKIKSSLRWLNRNVYRHKEFFVDVISIAEFMALSERQLVENIAKENVIIYARCANPRTDWTIKLRDLENKGYRVVNPVDSLELTSNKLACSLHLQGKVNHPKSWEYSKNMTNNQFMTLMREIDSSLESPEFFIAKPLTSLEQGANVKKIEMMEDTWENDDLDFIRLRNEINEVPGNKIVIQEFIDYIALHRVIVIDGKALPYTFIDKPEWHTNGDWKVSCCLNKTTMQICELPHRDLLELAEKTQKEVGGIINFIDIFQFNEPEHYTNAEINSACNLTIHEGLAKDAGRDDWNIHYRIAKELVKQLGIR